MYNNVNVALVTTKCLFIGYHGIGNNQLQVVPMINSMFVRYGIYSQMIDMESVVFRDFRDNMESILR